MVRTFQELSDQMSEGVDLTFPGLIRGLKPYGTPYIDASSVPAIDAYPDDLSNTDLFPWTWFTLLVATTVYNIYDGARSHWGTKFLLARKNISNILFDIAAVVAFIGMVLDTVVSANGSYIAHGYAAGIEPDANVRQFAAVMGRLGVNYARSLMVVDVVDLAAIVSTWYYGRRTKNFVNLAYLVFLAYVHISNFMLWPTEEGLIDFGLFFRQLAGEGRENQGGGPQTVVGIA